MDIEESNKLIAEFMGRHQSKCGVFYVKSDGSASRFAKKHPRFCNYNSDWRWIMPVVDKISAYVYDTPEYNSDGNIIVHHPKDRAYTRTFGMIDDESGDYMVRINRMSLHKAPKLIDAVYSAVVEWIEWYNRELKPKNE
jgi:hypothetical protein